MTTIPPSSTETLESALNALESAKNDWIKVDVKTRTSLLQRLLDDTYQEAEAWVASACKGKGVERGSSAEGEEWIGAYMPVLRNIRLLRDALAVGGKPRFPGISKNDFNQHVVQIFPRDLKEKLMFSGFSAEIWIEPDHEPTQGQTYVNPPEHGKLALILGAGNQSSIGPMDCLYKLFVENQVCLLKMNPVNEVVGPNIEKAFKSLIESNWLRVVYGGADTGKFLCQHAKVDTIHITGSDKTHDAIVWGAGEKQSSNKASGKKENEKPITSELGCVTPIIVAPGKWKEKELEFQARHIASMVTHNASFNCNAGKLVVLPTGWAQGESLKSKIIDQLKQIPSRGAYYPGAHERYQAFVDKYPDAIPCGEVKEGTLPWTVLPNVPATSGEYALGTEAFCGILAFTEISGDNAATFLANAVTFCNEKVWGTLSSHIFIDPRTEKSNQKALKTAIANLKYGAIAINCWTGVNYGMAAPSWGAFPGHSLDNIESGIGSVHNTYLIDHPEKSIVRAPFLISPTPAWFADNKNTIALGKKLVEFEHKPTWMRLVGVAMAALKG